MLQRLKLFVPTLAFLSLFIIGQGQANEGSFVVYSVSNIEVDATASTAVRAREVAILEGHAIALRRLLRRLTLPEDWRRLPRLSGKEAQPYSLGYSMTQEKNSATRYTGRIAVRFVPERVRRLLKRNKIPFGDVQTSSALIIPVYDLPNGRRLLWGGENVWRDAWGRPDITESLTPFTLPVGDIEDILILPEKKANVGNRRELFRLARRYNVNRILLAHARLKQVNWKGERGYALQVTLHFLLDYKKLSKDEKMEFSLAGSPSPQPLVERGVNDILRMMSISWKRRIIVYHDEVNEQEVEVRFTSLFEWQKLRQKLRDVSVIKEYETLRLDNDSALLKFKFLGSEKILSLALKQKDIELIVSEEEGEPWQLKQLR